MEAKMNFKSVNELLDFAMSKEDEAAKFYTDLAKKSSSGSMKNVFLEFAKEEQGHRAKLQAIKSGRLLVMSTGKVVDLKIADQVEDVKPGKELTYQEALILAMKREKGAFKLYSDLAKMTDDDGVRGTLLVLAQEEAKHKLRFEIEYDEYILQEN
jgi:rubrerythrin